MAITAKIEGKGTSRGRWFTECFGMDSFVGRVEQRETRRLPVCRNVRSSRSNEWHWKMSGFAALYPT